MGRPRTLISLGLACLVLAVAGTSGRTSALGSTQNPQSDSLGLQATIPSPPPSTGATIAVPTNGQSFSTLPITISGICPSNLLIKTFSNNIFVGSALCSSGSYSLKIDLFSGRNDIYVQDFDNLGQGGPKSNIVTVNFSGGQAPQPQNQVLLTSNYAKLGIALASR